MVEVSLAEVEFSDLLHIQKQLVFVMQKQIEGHQSIQDIDETHRVVVRFADDLFHQVATIAYFGLEAAVQH